MASGTIGSQMRPISYSTFDILNGYFDERPTSSSSDTYTFSEDGWLYIYATRGSGNGYTLIVSFDGVDRFSFPAYDSYAVVTIVIPVMKGQVLRFRTDSTSGTWTLREVVFMK